MAGSRQTIRAVYENGVLRPIDPLDLPEGSSVEVTVDPEGVVQRFENLIRSIHERNKDIPLEEIERDVELVIKEVRQERKANQSKKDSS